MNKQGEDIQTLLAKGYPFDSDISLHLITSTQDAHMCLKAYSILAVQSNPFIT